MAHTEPPALATAEEASRENTHDEARTRFLEVIAWLQANGWEYARVDTLVRSGIDPSDRHQMTIRHHYDHGVWELSYEPHRYWDRASLPVAVVSLNKYKPLETVEQIVHKLGVNG